MLRQNYRIKKTMKTPEETAKEANRHHDWAGPKKSSMKRRCNQHDYRDRGIYIMTLCLEGQTVHIHTGYTYL